MCIPFQFVFWVTFDLNKLLQCLFIIHSIINIFQIKKLLRHLNCVAPICIPCQLVFLVNLILINIYKICWFIKHIFINIFQIILHHIWFSGAFLLWSGSWERVSSASSTCSHRPSWESPERARLAPVPSLTALPACVVKGIHREDLYIVV
jgi:hypothetical protein